jgi:hypothetical protein
MSILAAWLTGSAMVVLVAAPESHKLRNAMFPAWRKPP